MTELTELNRAPRPSRAPEPSPPPERRVALVDRDGVGAFVARVRALQDERPELAVLCTGPWPPYSFAAPKP